MNPVMHYGLHFKGDLFFLHESTETKEARCLTLGLAALASPFEVVRSDRLRCPHAYPHANGEAVVPPDGLIRKLSPIPDGGAFWVPPAAKDVIIANQHLCCLTRSNVFVPWAHPMQMLVGELAVTNLSPLIILGYEARHIVPICQLLDVPRVRTIILCGPYRLPGSTAIDFSPSAEELSGPDILQAYVNQEVEKARCGN